MDPIVSILVDNRSYWYWFPYINWCHRSKTVERASEGAIMQTEMVQFWFLELIDVRLFHQLVLLLLLLLVSRLIVLFVCFVLVDENRFGLIFSLFGNKSSSLRICWRWLSARRWYPSLRHYTNVRLWWSYSGNKINGKFRFQGNKPNEKKKTMDAMQLPSIW